MHVGCFTPDHKCIDNVIHARAGPRLRAECWDMMKGELEATGRTLICVELVCFFLY